MSLTLHRLFCITFSLGNFVFCFGSQWKAEGDFLVDFSDEKSEFHREPSDWPWCIHTYQINDVNPDSISLSSHLTASSTQQYEEGTIELAQTQFSYAERKKWEQERSAIFESQFNEASQKTLADSKGKTTLNKPRIQVGTFPIELVSTKAEAFLIRLLHQSETSKDPIISSNRPRFKYLMTAIEALYRRLSSHERYPTFQNAVTEPTAWFLNIVFGNEKVETSLPLLATIRIQDLPDKFKALQIIQDFSGEPETAEERRISNILSNFKSKKYEHDLGQLFDEAQLLTATFLTKVDRNLYGLGEVAVKLLAYWYNNVACNQYEANLHQIPSFWKLMNEALQMEQ